MRRRAAAAAIGALAAACGVREAAACSPVYRPSTLARPVFEPAGAARIASENLDVACGLMLCKVVATYRLETGGEARVTVAGRRAWQIALEVDGVAADTVRAGARELRVTATVELWPYSDSICYEDGILARHPRFGSRLPRLQRVLEIETAARPRVRHASEWGLEIREWRAREPERGERDTTTLWFHLPPPPVLHGGPFALAGGAIGAGGPLRLRAGWEIAAPRWLILALAADTDASSTVSIAATVEATSRAWVGLGASQSIGGGAILALLPDVRPGGRAQAGLALGRARLVFSLDVLAPVADGQSVSVSGAVLAGFSL